MEKANYAYNEQGESHELGLAPEKEVLRKKILGIFQKEGHINDTFLDKYSIPAFNNVMTFEECIDYYKEWEFQYDPDIDPELQKEIEPYL